MRIHYTASAKISNHERVNQTQRRCQKKKRKKKMKKITKKMRMCVLGSEMVSECLEKSVGPVQ